MATPEQVEHYEGLAADAKLRVAARAVVDAWESGDLAGAVRWLSAVLGDAVWHLTDPDDSTLCGYTLSTRPHDARYVPAVADFDAADPNLCPVCVHVDQCEDDSCCVSHDATGVG